MKSVDSDEVRGLSNEAGISQFLAQIMLRRGFSTSTEVTSFIRASVKELAHPFEIDEMRDAVHLVVSHTIKRSRILIYGDYDVDGICSTAILMDYLTKRGAEVDYMIADRFGYGYGLGLDEARKIDRIGADCVIIVDCGTSDFKAVSYLSEKGKDVIIIDHHLVGDELPPAKYFVNPQRGDGHCEFKFLTTSGLSFYFVAGCEIVFNEMGVNPGHGAQDPRQYLDFAAVGTIADVAPLKKLNRIIVKWGLKRLFGSSRPSFKRITSSSSADEMIFRQEFVSFRLCPLLNAAGRMKDATVALKLLLADCEEEAARYHEEISFLNEQRKLYEKSALQKALKLLGDKISGVDGKPSGIVVASQDFHPGVVGIVSVRISQMFGLPSAVISFEQELGRGSIRAPFNIDIFNCLKDHRDIFVRFGGHSSAIGFTIERKNLNRFSKIFYQACSMAGAGKGGGESLSKLSDGEEIEIDAAIALEELSHKHLLDLGKIAPFGEGNPMPVLLVKNVRPVGVKVVGRGHLRFTACSGANAISVFGPNMGARLSELKDNISIVCNLRKDNYRGGENIELKLIDFKEGEPCTVKFKEFVGKS